MAEWSNGLGGHEVKVMEVLVDPGQDGRHGLIVIAETPQGSGHRAVDDRHGATAHQTFVLDEAEVGALQELLGHASPATTQVYTHITGAEARRAYMTAHPRARKVQR